MRKKENAVIKAKDGIRVIVSTGDVGYIVAITRAEYMDDRDCLCSVIHNRDTVMKLFYRDRDDMIGTLRFVEISGLDLHTVVAPNWVEYGPHAWRHYKNARITYNEEGGFGIDFNPKEATE
jgi:hypothetical protein